MSSPARQEKIVASGPHGRVECAVRLSGKMPARDFLEKLEKVRESAKDKPQPTARGRFMMLFQEMVDQGKLSKHFSQEVGKLYAFKLKVRNRQIRFPCFQDGSCWVLTHGFFKPGAQKGLGDWPQTEIERAQNIMGEYWEQKNIAKQVSRGGGNNG